MPAKCCSAWDALAKQIFCDCVRSAYGLIKTLNLCQWTTDLTPFYKQQMKFKQILNNLFLSFLLHKQASLLIWAIKPVVEPVSMSLP